MAGNNLNFRFITQFLWATFDLMLLVIALDCFVCQEFKFLALCSVTILSIRIDCNHIGGDDQTNGDSEFPI